MHSSIKTFLSGLAMATALISPAAASLLVTVDKTSQTMTVDVDGQTRYRWPVSTGLASYDTPNGTYKPFRMEASHFSREWDNAPMPHSIFFSQIGHAIHGTTQVRHLGRAASHGCVRLSPHNAATLFSLVKAEKMANSQVVVTGRVATPMVERDEPRAKAKVARRPRDEDAFARPVRVTRRPAQSDPNYQPAAAGRGYYDPYARSDPYAQPRRGGVFGNDLGW